MVKIKFIFERLSTLTTNMAVNQNELLPYELVTILLQVNENLLKNKSRIRETPSLSTDADSSTDTTVGWTKNTQKPNFFFKWKKSSKTQELKNV